jgi:hypothetical protein
MAHPARCRHNPKVSPCRAHGTESLRDVFDFYLTDEDVSRIATMDTGASLFFDHRDPAMVSWLNSRKGI